MKEKRIAENINMIILVLRLLLELQGRYKESK